MLHYIKTTQSLSNAKFAIPVDYDSERCKKVEDVNGLEWRTDLLLDYPKTLSNLPKTRLKEEHKHNFNRNPLNAFLAFLPISFWENHRKETNKYALLYMKAKNTLKSFKIHGYKFREVTIQELMIFYGILIQMTTRPMPGRPYTDCWKFKKEWFPSCNKMGVRRFKVIRTILHWNDNEVPNLMRDSAYKIRPILDVLDKSLGMYVIPGNSLALDETTCSITSTHAKGLIHFDPSKPKGKHHCLFYSVCENDYGNVVKINIAHKKYIISDPSEEKNENTNGSQKEKPISKNMSKYKSNTEMNEEISVSSSSMDSTETSGKKNFIEKRQYLDSEVDVNMSRVPELLSDFWHTGRVVNMDRAYTSPRVFIKLLNHGLFARGTVKLDSQYLPSFIRFKKK